MDSAEHFTACIGGENFRMSVFGGTDGPASGAPAPIVFLLHGAAMSRASWALCAKAVLAAQHKEGVTLCAPDMRGHGETEAAQSVGMSREQLAEDAVQCILWALEHVYKVPVAHGIYIFGHSLGGAIAAAAGNDPRLKDHVQGMCLVDIVEETALLNLKYMKPFLERRPDGFDSLDAAADWMCAEGGLKNRASAAVSVPPLLKPRGDVFVWVTDLGATEPFWEGWFTGMNALFLAMPCPKMLLIAGTERLDRGLTVAQMQGKFQLEVARDCGHHVQEDLPALVAEKLLRFVGRIDKLTRALPAPRK